MRDSFVFYASFLDATDEMTDAEELAFYRALARYAIRGEETPGDLPKASRIAFSVAKPLLDAATERYDIAKKRAEGGRLGGRPRSKKPSENLSENLNENLNENLTQNLSENLPQNLCENLSENPNVHVNVHVNANVNENENVNKNLQSLTEKEGEIKESEEKGISGGFSQKDYTDFMAEFDVRADSYNADLGSIDFRKVAEAYRMSPFLRTDEQAHWLSWICRHYEKIVAGYYGGRVPRQKSGEMVQDTLRELKRRAIEEDKDGEAEEF